MVAYRNLNPEPADVIKNLFQAAQAKDTSAHGQVEVTADEGIFFITNDGAEIPLDGELLRADRSNLDSALSRVGEAELELAAAEGRITQAEADLVTADGRITETQSNLSTAKTELEAADSALASRSTALELWRQTDVDPDLLTLNQKIAGSAGTLAEAESALSTLDSRIDTHDASISAAETRLDAAEGSLTTTQGELDTLEVTVGDVQAAAAAAQADADAAQGTANTAITNAQTAQAAADAAAADAATAQAAADDADAAALAASGLAESKGKVLYQSTAPTGADATTQNLWIKTPENIPHTWDATNGWVARTDKTATDAAAAASTANDAADAAQADATQALSNAAAADQKAADALTAAGNAQATADGKNTVTYATTTGAPPVTGRRTGDLHWVVSSASPYNVREQWRFNGTAWVRANLDSTVIANLDVGKLTGVFANISQHLSAGSITSDLVMIGMGGNIFPDPTLKLPSIKLDIPDAWEDGIAGEDGMGSFLIPSGTTQTGVYFGMVNGNARTRVTPGASYYVSAKVRLADAMTHEAGVAIYCRVYKSNDTGWAFASPSNVYLDWNWIEDTYGSRVAPSNTWLPISGMFKIPEGYDQLVVGLYVNGHSGVVPAVRWCKITVEPAADGRLIVDGSVTAKAVDAESVAAAVGEFVQVKAANVEVTQELSTRVANVMDLASRNLIVTGNTELLGETYIRDLASEEIVAASITVGQLTTTGSATIAEAVVDEFWGRFMAVKQITAENVVIASGYNLMPNGRGEKVDKYPFSHSDVFYGNDSTILSGSAVPSGPGLAAGYFYTPSSVGKTTAKVKVKAGAKYTLRVSHRAELTGQSYYWQVRWLGPDNSLVSSEYLESNKIAAAAGTWEHLGPLTREAPAGAIEAYFSLYGNHTNGTQGGVAYWTNMIFAEQVEAELIVDGAITSNKVTADAGFFNKLWVTETLTAKKAIFEEGLEATDATFLGTTVSESLNVTKLLSARNAIINGTLDVEQLNVTGEMMAEILTVPGTLTARQAFFTEGLTTNDAELLGTTIAERIDVDKLGANLVTAGTIKTPNTGSGFYQIDNLGYHAYNAAGAETVRLDGVSNLLTGDLQTAATGSMARLLTRNSTTTLDFFINNEAAHFAQWYDGGTAQKAGFYVIPEASGFNYTTATGMYLDHPNRQVTLGPGLWVTGGLRVAQGTTIEGDFLAEQAGDIGGQLIVRGRLWTDAAVKLSGTMENGNAMQIAYWAGNGPGANSYIDVRVTYQYSFPSTGTRHPFISIEAANYPDIFPVIKTQTTGYCDIRIVNKSTGTSAGWTTVRVLTYRV